MVEMVAHGIRWEEEEEELPLGGRSLAGQSRRWPVARGRSSKSRRLWVAKWGGFAPLATFSSSGRSPRQMWSFVTFCAVFSQKYQCVSSSDCLDSTPDSSDQLVMSDSTSGSLRFLQSAYDLDLGMTRNFFSVLKSSP